MIYLNSDYVITPLGDGVTANLEAVRNGKSCLRLHENVHGEQLVTPAVASLVEAEKYIIDGYTLFESLCIHAVDNAKKTSTVDISNSKCVFILSSTKADIWPPMAETARHISTYFGNFNEPIVVSNACTSGVSAQLTAYRLIQSGLFSSAVVVGCDVQCDFIVSGFQSFRALSSKPCKPFDANRDGLNVGEAAACMILDNQQEGLGWQLLGGSIHNDANHISGPSRTAEGSLRCLEDMKKLVPTEDLALVSVHGTGTNYNDEMESIAIHRAELQEVPVTALKGNYGHTMGAAGLLETILSLHALDEGIVLPTKGYESQGTTYAVSLSNDVRHTEKKSFIKLLSGFGGINSAVAWRFSDKIDNISHNSKKWSTVTEVTVEAPENLTNIYREIVGDYPKFFKMDLLSKLGFIGFEKLIQQVRTTQPDFALDNEKTVVIVANKSSSLKNDTDFQETIKDKNNYYPSPALFVYTLPNIVAGEIAIRHKLFGETACYVINDRQDMEPIVQSTMMLTDATQIVAAWIECSSSDKYIAHIKLII